MKGHWMSQNNKIIRLNEVMDMTGLSRSTIYRMMDKEDFPLSTSLGERAIGWSMQEVQEWVQNKLNIRNRMSEVNYESETE